MLIKTAAAVAMVLALAGCGGSDSTGSAEPKPSASLSSTTAAPAAATLKDTCPQVEAAIDGMDFDSDPADLAAAEQTVLALSAAGDVETQNALEPVLTALRKSQTATQGETSADAFDAWTDAGRTIGDRCKAAGSSAFQ